MTPGTRPRRIADGLMRFAMRITPADQIDWARAMRSEMNHVEGDWAALRWAIGGASALARRAVVRAIFPRDGGRGEFAGKDLIVKEGSLMRKTTLAAAGACIVASLLFFLAPAFRQAFQVSLTQWRDIIHVTSRAGQPDLASLARRAEQQRDPEGLAFVAIHEFDPVDSARRAEEAVHLDPDLTWVYAVVAIRQSEFSESDEWIAQLEKWDPQNALPYLIAAERIDGHEVAYAGAVHKSVPFRMDQRSAVWQDDLAAAFQSAKLDRYLDRLTELERRVLSRYGIDDPYVADLSDSMGYGWRGLPSYAAGDSWSYAQSLVKSGEALEAQGDKKGALEKYGAVTRFANMLGWPDGFFMSSTTQVAYARLAAISLEDGNTVEAGFYSDLAARTGEARRAQFAAFRQPVIGGAVSRWNASVVKTSGLMMLVFSALALICVLSVSAKSLLIGAIRASRAASTILVGSVVGMLLSCAMLYVSYRPYAEMFRSYVRDGDVSRIQDLSDFLAYTRLPIGVHDFGHVSYFVFDFWFGITTLCAIGLMFALYWYFASRPQTSPAI